MPVEEPGDCVHGRPAQQSADVVHVPPCATQEPLAPHLWSTHGFPQQSALVAQSWPAGTVPPSVQTKLTARQRGMPRASREQQASGVLLHKSLGVSPPSGSTPSQQLFDVPPQAPVGALQTSPGGRHCSELHVPRVSPAAIWQVIVPLGSPFDWTPVGWPGPPQQSPLVEQISSCGLQPEGG
jgi:hypothetical protein